MIHAYLIKTNDEDEDDDYGYIDENGELRNIFNHGPNFQAQMFAINEMAKLNITVSTTVSDFVYCFGSFFYVQIIKFQ